MRTAVAKIWEYILSTVFPKRCLGCSKFDTWLCDACHTRLPLITEQQCPICTDTLTPMGQTCPQCSQKLSIALDGVYVASTHHDALLKKAIHYYKYKFIDELAQPLALLLAQGLTHSKLESPDILIAVPLHKRRLRWRGFNQSQLLLEELDLQIPHSTKNLTRKKFTTPQVKKGTRKKRLKNLDGAFAVQNPHEFASKKILLVDDITTTATTLNECAKALKKAGAKKVTALVIARD